MIHQLPPRNTRKYIRQSRMRFGGSAGKHSGAARFVITQFVTQKNSTRVLDVFHLADDNTVLIVPVEWAAGVAEISCEIVVNGESLGVKSLFVNMLDGRGRRRDIAAYSVLEKLELTEQDECVLILR